MKFKRLYLIFALSLCLLLFSYISTTLTKKQKELGVLGLADPKSDYILPRVHPNFITKEEANYILEKTKNNFKDSETVSGFDTKVRKSQTCWIEKTDPVVKNIITRVCEMENRPFENAEQLQVVKYEPNGFYNPHHDSCPDNNEESKNFLKSGGHRAVTMLIYLSEGFEGGATRFTNLDVEHKPPKCSGILFYPLDKDEIQCHPHAEHGGLPVTSGEKYIANVWIRQDKFTL
jgi:prolyl 4-hydroxylase